MNGSLGMSLWKFSKIINNFEKGPKFLQEIADSNTFFDYSTVHCAQRIPPKQLSKWLDFKNCKKFHKSMYHDNRPSEMMGGGGGAGEYENCGQEEK